MRAYRKITLSQGLFFKLPMAISSMVDEIDGSSLKGICPDCNDSIGTKVICKGCSKEFTFHKDKQILKSYKFSDDDQVVINAEQLEKAKNHIKQEIVIQGRIPISKIDYRNFTSKGYYLIPQNDKKKKTDNTKAYLTIFEGLKNEKEALVIKYSVTKDKEHLGLVIAHFDEATNTKCLIIKDTCYGQQLRKYDEAYEEDQIPNELEEQAGMSFVRKLDEIDPSTIANDFSLKFDEILKNPDQISIEVEETETKGSAMDMFAI